MSADLNIGDLVTMHAPDGRTYEGRYWYPDREPTRLFVIDWRRSSRADNGFRPVLAGSVVHRLVVRCGCPS